MPKGKHLGDLEELILLSVLRLGEGAHGGTVKEELGTHAARSVSVSTVYVTLMRLEEKGYVNSWKGEPSGTRGGKAKRHFEVRPEGVEALEAVRSVRDRMWHGVQANAR
jgi:PadR family transcriptional regulator PadR